LKRKKNTPPAGELRFWESDEEVENASPIQLVSPKSLKEFRTKNGEKRMTTRGRRIKKRFTEEEVENLYRGVVKYGLGMWHDIISAYDFGDRKPHDLKDKWRNLQKNEQECLRRINLEHERVAKNRAEKKKRMQEQREISAKKRKL